MIFHIFLLIIVCTIAISIIWTIVQWLNNNAQPEISSEVKILAIDDRRSGMSVCMSGEYLFNFSRGYYITYESISSGARKKTWVRFIELADIHSKVAVNDIGILTLQGTRYIKFVPH